MAEHGADGDQLTVGKRADRREDPGSRADHETFDGEEVLAFDLSAEWNAGGRRRWRRPTPTACRDPRASRHGDRAAVDDRALGHAGQHAARAEFGEAGDAGVLERQQAVFPAHGARQLGREQTRPVVATVVGHGVDVGDDRHVGVAWLGLGERVTEPFACRGHERRVERPRHLQRHDLLRAEFLGVERCRPRHPSGDPAITI